MQIAQVLAGYSLGEADLLRRAMGKKIKAEMAQQRSRFVEGAVENGVERGTTPSTSSSWSTSSPATASTRATPPPTRWSATRPPISRRTTASEFLAASMTLDMGNTDKLNVLRPEAQPLGHSHRAAVGQPLRGRFPAAATAPSAIRWRRSRTSARQAVEQSAPSASSAARFKDVSDFARAHQSAPLNKRALETLAAAGAFDALGINRATALANVERIMAAGNRSLADETGGTDDLFGGAARTPPPIELPRRKAWAPTERLQHEFEAVGFFLSGHPLDDYQEVLEALGAETWADFAAKAPTRGAWSARSPAPCCRRASGRRKSGNTFAFVVFSDPTGQFEAVMFSEALGRLARAARSRAAPCCSTSRPKPTARPSRRGVQRITSLEAAAEARHSGIKIYLEGTRALDSIAEQVGDRGGQGELRLVLRLDDAGREVEFVLPQGIDATPKQRSALKLVAGVAAVSAL